jgi:hypothetical protein
MLVHLLLNITLASEPSSHCATDETTYFSCSVKSEKVVSICGENFENENGFLQYRFGKLDKIEMVFPKTTEQSTKKFKRNVLIRPTPLASTIYEVHFSVSEWNYSVVSQDFCDNDKCSSRYGVDVTNGDKSVSLLCINEPHTNNLVTLVFSEAIPLL